MCVRKDKSFVLLLMLSKYFKCITAWEFQRVAQPWDSSDAVKRKQEPTYIK